MGFFFKRVRGVVGGDDFDGAVVQGLPKSLVVGGSFDRRVHLDQRAQAIVVVDVEEQMVRADFGSDRGTGGGDQVDFVSGGNVQDVKVVVVAIGKVDGSFGGDDRGVVVADFGVVGDVG